MKKVISFLLVIAMMLSLVIAIVPATAADATATPEGTAITTAAEFTRMRGDGKYYLDADITLTGTGREAAMMTNFRGTFDGNGHTITLVNYRGLFWRVLANGTVKNVTVKGNINLTSSKLVGGVALYNEGTLENVTSEINVTTDGNYVQEASIGGVCGEATTSGTSPVFIGCKFTGSIDVKKNDDADHDALKIGGILGRAANGISSLKFTNCVNKGTIKNTQYAAYVGGIVAWFDHVNVTLEGCVNEGDLATAGTKGAHIGFGGLIGCGYQSGHTDKKVIVKNSENKGGMSLTAAGSNTHTGGIIGRVYAMPHLLIENCVNSGDINVLEQRDWSAAGGMVGTFMTISAGNVMSWSNLTAAEYTIKNCENTGKIYGLDAGGMAGAGMQLCEEDISIKFENCLNTGVIYSYGNAGGMMGVTSLYSASYGNDYGNVKVVNCMNAGFVKGRNFSGGMIGYMNSANANTSLVSEISGCVNIGEIANAYLGEQYKEATVGGMVGQIERPVTVKNCVNLGTLTGPTINPSAVAPMVAANGKTVTASGNVCVDDYGKKNANATEKTADDIIKAVTNSAPALDDSDLMKAYEDVSKLKGEDYTEDSWNALAAAVEDTFALYEKVGVITKKDIDDAAKKINNALGKLVPITAA